MASLIIHGLTTLCSIGMGWCSHPCSSHHPQRTSPWAIFGGFPALLIMCTAGDGGHATLILLPSSGKYPSSLRRVKTTKSRVWLQPPGLSAPTRTRPRLTACCSLARSLALTHPSMRDFSSLKFTISKACGPSFSQQRTLMVLFGSSDSDWTLRICKGQR